MYSDAWLAAVNWTRECPCIVQPHSTQSCNMCGGISSPHSKLCENCSGTGRVAVLPGLRMPCSLFHIIFWRIVKISCAEAGCPGWQTAPRSRDTLEDALVAAGYKL